MLVMGQIEFYVYDCTVCDRETVLSSDSVSRPEVHIGQKESVFCSKCDSDIDHVFKGIEGLKEDSFVLDVDTREKYCPLCEGSCTV